MCGRVCFFVCFVLTTASGCRLLLCVRFYVVVVYVCACMCAYVCVCVFFFCSTDRLRRPFDIVYAFMCCCCVCFCAFFFFRRNDRLRWSFDIVCAFLCWCCVGVSVLFSYLFFFSSTATSGCRLVVCVRFCVVVVYECVCLLLSQRPPPAVV